MGTTSVCLNFFYINAGWWWTNYGWKEVNIGGGYDCLILEKAGQASFDVPESIEGIPPGFAYGIGLATGRRRVWPCLGNLSSLVGVAVPLRVGLLSPAAIPLHFSGVIRRIWPSGII